MHARVGGEAIARGGVSLILWRARESSWTTASFSLLAMIAGEENDVEDVKDVACGELATTGPRCVGQPRWGSDARIGFGNDRMGIIPVWVRVGPAFPAASATTGA